MPPTCLAASALRSGLALLLDADDAAHAVGAAPWEFALELSVLVDAGLSVTQLRWLISKGFLEHGIERLPRGRAKRSVHRVKWLKLTKKSCFVLSTSGIEYGRSICRRLHQGEHRSDDYESNGNGRGETTPGETPVWDRKTGRLTFRGQVVMEFLHSAPNLTAILDAFELARWCDRIDVPAALAKGSNLKSRRHNAINALNRKRIVKSLRFSTDDTGHGLRWVALIPRSVRREAPRRKSSRGVRTRHSKF